MRATLFTGLRFMIVFLMVAKSKADKALRESEANFRATFELAGVGKSQADPATGRLLRVNRKMCEITGYSASELLERTFLEITHPDDRAPGLGQLPADGQRRGTRLRFREALRAQGRHDPLGARQLDSDSRWRRQPAAGCRHHRGYHQAEAGRGAAPDDPREHRRRLHRLRQPVAVRLHQCAGRRLLRYRREEILGKTHWVVYPLTAGTRLQDEFQRAAAGESRDFEYYEEPWDRWFHHRCFPREGGGISVYFRDVTQRKRVEEANRESERRFHAMADTVPCLVWVTQDDGSLTFLNDRCVRDDGRNSREQPGVGMVRFYPSRGSRQSRRSVADLRSGGESPRDRDTVPLLRRRLPLVLISRRAAEGRRGQHRRVVRHLHRHRRPEADPGGAGRGDPGEGPFPGRPLARTPARP